MMRIASIVLAAALLAVVVSGADLLRRTSAPSGWIQVGKAPMVAPVTFHVGLRQTNLDELERRFFAVSDPNSDEHQNFMSIEEINALVAPKPQHKNAVYKWLTSSGIPASAILDYSDDFEVSTTVALATKLFGADLYFFKHADTGKIIINAIGTLSVPDELMEAISIVTGITTFPHPHLTSIRHKPTKPSLMPMTPPPENDAIIPQTIANMYGLPSLTIGSNPVSQGVIEFDGEAFTNADLQAFGLATGITILNVTKDHIIGPNSGGSGEESILDIQMIAGVNPSSTNWFWLEPGANWLYEFGVHYFNTTMVPDLASISYGWWEGDQCQFGGPVCTLLNVTSVGYVQAVDVLFQKIQLRGKTLLAASGDSGAHTRSDEGCSSPYLLADYPGTSPYLTSVGATEVVAPTYFPSWQAPVCTPGKQWNYTCVSGGYEVAVDITRSFFTSGGGFSNISATPAYQLTAVQAYLNQYGSVLPPMSMYNAKGRGRPDVSAVGHNAFIVDNGYPGLIGGTSQSSPIFTAVAALLTNEYIKITGKPFGFLNQVLYQAYAADPMTYYDVTEGDNICPEAGCNTNCRGWQATYGWDPVTGLGSPNYPRLVAYIQKLGANVVARRQAREAAKAAAQVATPAVRPRRDQRAFTSA